MGLWFAKGKFYVLFDVFVNHARTSDVILGNSKKLGEYFQHIQRTLETVGKQQTCICGGDSPLGLRHCATGGADASEYVLA